MELLRFTGLERHFGAKEVFRNLSGVIRAGEKIALVGPNGAGKSTLVRLLAGIDRPDDGTIARARDTRFGYLAQDAAESGPATLRAAFEEALARGSAHEWEMRATLNRFAFAESDLDRPLSEFSGGQRTRALLARTLLEEPDWLILDEPTNHLDLDTVRWLETFVARDARTYVIVSHDRYFLETVASSIWELADGELVEYAVTPGKAYSEFVEQRVERRAQQQRDYDASMTERERQRAVIAELRTHGSHNYSHVRSREKALDRVEVIDAPRKERRSISVALTAARKATTGIAIELVNVAKAYGTRLFANVNAKFARGETVAIVGPNGAGKTTLLRIIAGELAPDRGNVRYGIGLKTASYSQSSVDDLPAGVSAADAVAQMGVTGEEARSLLGRLNLGGDAVDKPVEAFSGGERRRIMLARLMAQRADCLFLDEPTNDLDIPSREALEDVLASYGGALFVVSHDRYLLKRLAQRVIAIRDGHATIVDGDYDTYEKCLHSPAPVTPETRTAAKNAANGKRAAHDAKIEAGRRKRAVADAEQRVADLDAEKVRLEARFAAGDLYEDPAAVITLQLDLDRVRGEIESAYEAWARATAALEGGSQDDPRLLS
ncbi:MAG TPA: ABC-F family ATP-binding cassette domain-containing protein [Candidatus Lustribacter sp.]|jgi:ATP-binding cassette subfamily F protein 3|nr:ABC-F family ATP-binding cassette domain-containing protein [Candidatus Lustribacter sp.]